MINTKFFLDSIAGGVASALGYAGYRIYNL